MSKEKENEKWKSSREEEWGAADTWTLVPGKPPGVNTHPFSTDSNTSPDTKGAG
jgi:hypothetical protein